MISNIVTAIPIRLKGEVYYFQLDLPADVKRILSCRVTTRINSNAPRPILTQAGMLTMQTTGPLNFFYSADIVFDHPWTLDQDLGFTAALAGFISASFLLNDRFSTQVKFFAEKIELHGCRHICGAFKDSAGRIFGDDISYDVTLNLEIERS